MNNKLDRTTYLTNNYGNTVVSFSTSQCSNSDVVSSRYNIFSADVVSKKNVQINTTIEHVAQWFLCLSPMSNKKLQKLCYYTYCWFIVFFNDVELITKENTSDIKVLCSDRFQAWIHGPVSPQLYQRYKEYGWQDIPQATHKTDIPPELESLLQQVWDAYGSFTADELEIISHNEKPWQNARKGIRKGEACSNEISDYDILQYYSSLG